jgi:hypothetical protein
MENEDSCKTLMYHRRSAIRNSLTFKENIQSIIDKENAKIILDPDNDDVEKKEKIENK